MCQGDVDHVGKLGKRATCPSAEELKADKDARRAANQIQLTLEKEEGEERARRKIEDAEKSRQNSALLGVNGEQVEKSSILDRKSLKHPRESFDSQSPSHLKELARRARLYFSTRNQKQKGHGTLYPYETLGDLPSSASPREVRKAYIHLSSMFHPDKNIPELKTDSETVFSEISAAYEILSDQVKREAHDAEAAGGAAFFTNEADAASSGRDFSNNLYSANGLVTELTEGSFSRRVSDERIFIVQFYAPWCGHCQASAPTFKATAELVTEDGLDVGAVNCISQPALCARFDIRAYPTVKILSGRGMVQDSTGVTLDNPDNLATWAREVAVEWRWLFSSSDVREIVGWRGFRRNVIRSLDFWLVLFLDGTECGPCRTARTNLMRLSASSRGRVRTGLVDCETEEPGHAEGGLCAKLGMPPPPHAPRLLAFHRGNKTDSDMGEALYDPAEIESHVALALVDKVLRLSGDAPEDGVVASGGPKWGKEDKLEAEGGRREPPPRPKWNGPPPRAIPAGGHGGGSPFIPNTPRLG